MRDSCDGWVRVVVCVCVRVLMDGQEWWWVGESGGECVRVLVGGRGCWWVGESGGGWMRVLVGM